MECWTEILSERVMDVHIGDYDIIVPIDDTMTASEQRHVLEWVKNQ